MRGKLATICLKYHKYTWMHGEETCSCLLNQYFQYFWCSINLSPTDVCVAERKFSDFRPLNEVCLG
jgi:hypothetical protein